MIEEYSTRVIRGRSSENEKGSSGKKRGWEKRKKGNPMDDRDHRRVVKPVVLFPPRGPLCLSALDFRLSHFPLSLRISRTPCPSHPRLHPRVRHFCLYFVVIVGRKRTSAPWKMAAVALPVRERSPTPVIPLPRSSLPWILLLTLSSQAKRVSSDRPPRRVLSFYSLPVSCPTLAIDPRPNRDHLTQRATCVLDVTQTKRFIIVPWAVQLHVIVVIVTRHFREPRCYHRAERIPIYYDRRYAFEWIIKQL